MTPRAAPCLLAVGAPDYDAGEGRSTDRGHGPRGEAVAEETTPRPAHGWTLPPLPGAADEAAHAAELWAEAGPEYTSLLLTGSEATEPAVLALAPGVRVLHLATHGFALGSRSVVTGDPSRGVGGLAPAAVVAAGGVPPPEAPRVSGLALAGANRGGLDSSDDGILTAEEIAASDLSGVEWAVLSACESGVGEASSGEGVFGLRRAFLAAGARTVITSLWAVEDEPTREWMTALYRARLVDGASTAEAVRRASREVLEARRRRGESVHPSTWAAFVATGDWR